VTAPSDAGFLFVGGDPAVDFANTVVRLGGARVDLLDGDAAADRWLAEARTRHPAAFAAVDVPPGAPPVDPGAARALRDAVRRLVEALALDGPVEAVDAGLAGLDGFLVQHPVALAVRRVGERRFEPRLVPAGPAAGNVALLPVAAAVVDLVAGPAGPATLRQCDDGACILLFRDTSRNRRRRWCSMQLCGNRAKVAAHYRRSHASDA
jgi:predicted RNA-binding Zn ribbon-like protein